MTAARTVLLADPQSLNRAGLRTILAGAGLDVVAETGDAAEAVAQALQHRPGICIIDTGLPGGWLPTVTMIAERVRETAVVVSAPAVSDDVVVAAILAGASGVLESSASVDGLLRAVEGVLSGEAAVPRAAIGRLISELRGSGSRRISLGGLPLLLTARESQVLELVRGGLTTNQIAGNLGVSPVTVRRHVSSIVAKGGPNSRSELRRRRTPAVPR